MANCNTHRNVVDIKPNVRELDAVIAHDLQAPAMTVHMTSDETVKLHSRVLIQLEQKMAKLDAKIKEIA